MNFLVGRLAPPGGNTAAAAALVLLNRAAAAKARHHFDQLVVMETQSAQKFAEPDGQILRSFTHGLLPFGAVRVRTLL